MCENFKDILKSMEIQKNVKETFDEIQELQTSQNCNFTFLSSRRTETGVFSKYKNKHTVIFSANRDYQTFSKSLFSARRDFVNNLYHSDDALITTISFDQLPQFKYEVSISNLHKGEKSQFYRIVLPLDKDLCLNRLFDSYTFCFNQQGWGSELVKTYIEGREFHIYKLSKSGENYLFIDCLAEIEYQVFYEQVICILCALGIFTGYFVENECFILSSDRLEFNLITYVEFRSLRKSKYAMNEILPVNPYTFWLLTS